MGEEIALARRRVDTGLPGQSGAIIRLVGDEAGIDQQAIELVGARFGQAAIGGGIADLADRGEAPVAHFLEPERGERAVELALEQDQLRVIIVGAQEDVGQVPIVIGLADPRRTDAPGGFGLDPGREALGREPRRMDRGAKRGAGPGERGGALAPQVVEHKRPVFELGEHLGLLVEGAIAIGPQVMRATRREVASGIAQQRRNRAERLRQPRIVSGGQGVTEIVEVDVGLGRGAFMRRDVAHLAEHGLVEARIARPRA